MVYSGVYESSYAFMNFPKLARPNTTPTIQNNLVLLTPLKETSLKKVQ